MARFASRIRGVDLSLIRRIMLQARGCLNLGIGEPDFFAPRSVRCEAARVLEQDKIGYSPNAGLPEFCRAVAEYHGVQPESRVSVTNGSQEALFDTLFALVETGDEVLVPDPGFVAYPTVAELCGARAVPYPLPAAAGFALDREALLARITERTRALILVTPSNPTGQYLDRKTLSWIAGLAREHGFTVISDEIYREIYYGERPPSMLETSDSAVVLSGVSKMAAMTGWRLGWAVGPEEIIRKVNAAHQYTSSCASTLSQKAALRIFTEEGRGELAELRSSLTRNRETACAFLRSAGRSFVPPQGAFYLMLSIEETGMESTRVSQELIRQGVATIPGVAFGREGEGYLRLSFACQPQELERGLEILERGLERLGRR